MSRNQLRLRSTFFLVHFSTVSWSTGVSEPDDFSSLATLLVKCFDVLLGLVGQRSQEDVPLLEVVGHWMPGDDLLAAEVLPGATTCLGGI